MRIMKYCITLILLLFGIGVVHSQEKHTGTNIDFRADRYLVSVDTLENSIRLNKQYEDIEVHFRFDKYNIDLNYMGNEISFKRFAHKIDSIGISKIDSIVIISQSSPEGTYEHNRKLSINRANTMRKYILENHPELQGRLKVHPDGESWERLREYVNKDTLLKKASIEKIVSIIDADINIAAKKLRISKLSEYRYIYKTYYPRIRNSAFCIAYFSEIIPAKKEWEPAFIIGKVEIEPVVEVILPDTIHIAPIAIPEMEVWTPRLHLKTNAIGLGMAIANVAAEVDLAKHYSFTLPVYYSAWNYFKSTIKFRTFAVQPELRYWLSEENDGFFGGVHFGLAYYNFAFDGDYRYQDHNRETPAIGGGVSIGYRLPISQNNRWRVEFSLGAGVYSNHYDKFHNTPRTKDGQMIESIKKTYWGIDQAAVSFSYSFDLKWKGGK